MDIKHDIYIGIDIGKTKILIGVVDFLNKKIVERFEHPSAANAVKIVEVVSISIDLILKKYNVKGIGIGTFGIIDTNLGMIVSDGSLGSRNFPIKKLLQDKYIGINIYVDNDANVAAIGEYFFYYLNHDISMITIGTSIGIGSVISGKVYYGKHFLSGEIAHLHFLSDQLTLSQISGGRGIVDRMADQTGRLLTTEEIINMAINNSDENAVKIIRDAVLSLTNTIFLIQNLLDVDYIILGGGLIIKNRTFYELIANEVNKQFPPNYAFSLPFGIQIRQAALISDSCIWGGAVLCKQMMT